MSKLPEHISISLTELFENNPKHKEEIEEMINEQLQDYLRDTYGNDFESVWWNVNLDVDVDWYDEDDPNYLK